MDWLKEVEKAAKEVFGILGEGYVEGEYEEALAHELRLRKIPYERQKGFEITYKGYWVGEGIADFIINSRWFSKEGKELVLEVKKANKISEAYKRQAQVYMVSLDIDDGAVLCFGDEVLLEVVEKPKKMLDATVVAPGRKTKRSLKDSLKESANEVYEYFGKEFTYRDDRKGIFTSAIGVALRLRRIDFFKGSYDILYKNHKISSYSFDFLFAGDEGATIIFYEDEKEIKNQKEELAFYRKPFKLNKCYLVALPRTEEGEVKVEVV